MVAAQYCLAVEWTQTTRFSLRGRPICILVGTQPLRFCRPCNQRETCWGLFLSHSPNGINGPTHNLLNSFCFVLIFDELCVMLAVALSGHEVVYLVLSHSEVRPSPAVQVQLQSFGIGVVSGPVDVGTLLDLEDALHYLTFLSLLFFAFAAGLALRVALAKIAPADSLL